MRKAFFVFLLVPLVAGAQTGDSILIHERTMDRPLILHGGQLRVSGNYLLNINSNRFDSSGGLIDLSKDGTASVSNSLNFEIKYGITNMFQLTLSTGNYAQALKAQTHFIVLIDEPALDIHRVDIYEGWRDLFAAIDFRAPIPNKRIDLIVSAGALLPTAPSGQALPSHTITPVDPAVPVNSQFQSIYYQYNHQMGNGTPVYQGGLQFKYRLTNMAFTVGGNYWMPSGETSMMAYDEALNGLSFTYREAPYKFLRPDEMNFNVEAEYQAYPWFDLIAAVTYQSFTGGYSYESGVKVDNPGTNIMGFVPGFEIIVTPRVWLRERVFFPVSGAYQLAPVSFTTTINYNVFLFNK